jgi:hypothetical protein
MTNKFIVLTVLGLVVWSIKTMGGQDQFTQILGADVTGLEMLMGIVGATISCQLLM